MGREEGRDLADTPAALVPRHEPEGSEQPTGEGKEQGRSAGGENQPRRLSGNLHKPHTQVG